MNFQTKKIRKEKPKKDKPKEEPKPKKEKKISIRINAGIIGSLLIIILLFFGIAKAFSSIDFSIFLTVAGEKLEIDENGNSNFMILGSGGEEHEGADLTDSIIVVSLNHEKNSISMLSIPRDTYVTDAKVGNSRINQIYPSAQRYYGDKKQAAQHTKSVLEDMLNIPIHYWITMNFNGFVEIIDILGGIEIIVKHSIYDPYYPKDGTYLYEPFSIGAGLQQMDGETALKYARSRQTTSDFDRSRRQQEIIYAAKEKALKTNILFSREKINEILQSLQDNIQTNISVREILTLGGMAENYSHEDIHQFLMHDDPTRCGGFLYPPERRLYSGMFVLLPAGGEKFLHKYTDLIFRHHEALGENIRIHVLNGTSRAGSAGETRTILRRFCFEVPRFGNALTKDIQETTYYYRSHQGEDTRPKSLDFLQTLIPGNESKDIPQEYLDMGYLNDSDVILELGADYTNSELYMRDPFASMWRIQTPKTPTETETTTEIESSTETESPPANEQPTTTDEDQ